MCDDVKSYL